MRPIKFRGRVPDDQGIDAGKIVYGSLVDHGESKYGYRYWIYPLESDRNYPVAPDTVAQLVGYDANGKEVYEGDTVIEEYVEGECKEHIARLESMTQVPETAQFYFFPFPAPFTILKEQPS